MKKYLLTATALVLMSSNAWADCAADEAVGKKGECVKKSGACGTDCVYDYDESTKTMTFRGTGENGAGEVDGRILADYYLNSALSKLDFDNLIVAEGITKVSGVAFQPALVGGSGQGKLVLPATLKEMGFEASFVMNFATVEINSTDLSFDEKSFRFSRNGPVEIIMPASDKIIFGENSGMNIAPENLTITCRGEIDICQQSFGNALSEMDSSKITYNGYQKNPDGSMSLYQNNKLIATYATDAKDGSVYTYNPDGELISIRGKKIYTVEEAEAVTAHGDKFHVSLTYK